MTYDDRVSTETFTNHHQPSIAYLADGGWVIAWTNDESYDAIYQRRYDADGNPYSDEVQVSSYATASMSDCSVAALADGGWVVTWTSYGQDGSGYGVYQQRFDPDGVMVGDETLVNTHMTGSQFHSYVTGLSDGGWLVVWDGAGAGDDYGIFSRRYNADGDPVTSDEQINVYTDSLQADPKVALLNGGGWVITWMSRGQDGDDDGIYQQLFDSDGNKVGVESQVHLNAAGWQDDPVITPLASGGWVVVWKEPNGGDYYNDYVFTLYQQEFDADGDKVNGVTQVTDAAGRNGDTYRVSALDDGGWVVAWQGSDADLGGIYYQRFNAAGGAIGVAVRVNDIQANNQTFASVVGTDDGGWIITWSSDDDDTSIGHYQIHQKRYDSGGAAVELGIGGTPPRAADVTVKLTEDHSYLFSKKDFHYFDYDGDKFAHVTIVTVPDTGVLKLGGSKVHDGDVIAASALSNLKFVPAKNQIGEASFEFSVGDKSGKESHLSYSFAFEIKDVVDTFRGNKKANTLDGTDGSDILDGKQGNDTLTGGDSSDRFVFKTGYDRDAITDFAATGTEHDVVDLRGLSSVKNWNDLVQHHMSQVGDDVVINGLKGDVLTLQHVQLADLDKGDFLF